MLHADAGKSDAGTLAWLAHPTSQVSYHALIGRNGALYTVVGLAKRAWHAGKASWNGLTDVNSVSAGLAFANRHDGTEPLTPIQIAVGLSVVQLWAQTIPTLEGVTTHALVAPARKTDPNNAPGFRLEDYQQAFRAARGGAS